MKTAAKTDFSRKKERGEESVVSIKGFVVRSSEKHVVDGIEVQRLTVEEGKKKTLCLLSGEQTGKARAGDFVEVQGIPKRFNAKDRAFGEYLLATKLEKIEPLRKFSNKKEICGQA